MGPAVTGGVPFLPSPTIVGPAGPNFVCLTGRVNLFQFIQAPSPGSVIGELSVAFGGSIPLIQTRPTPFGGLSLAAVDRQFATVCGNLTFVGGQVVLDVRFVSAGVSPFFPGFFPGFFPRFPFGRPFRFRSGFGF